MTLVVASARNGVIGFEGRMPWHLPADLKHFKRVTLGHSVIMGRKTFEAIGKPLPGRINVVLSRDPELRIDGAETETSLEQALRAAQARGETEVMVIGGGQIYVEALPLASRIWLTEVDASPEGDTYFPPLAEGEWIETERSEHSADENNNYNVSIRCFQRLPVG